MKKRFLSTLLTLCMVLTLLPIKAWAVESRTTPKDPSVTELTVTYSDGGTDKTMPLLPVESNQPQIPLPADGQLTFQIRFDNWEQLDKVYVTSTKDNNVKYLEAITNGTAGSYTASGCFEPDDISYVPGKISVEYTKKTDNVKISDNVDWNTLQTALKDYCTTTVNSASGEAVQATVDISKLLNAEKDVAINVAIDVFDETTGGSLNDWLGYYHDLESMQKRVLEGGNYYLYLDDTNLSSYVFMVIRDVSESKYTKLVLDEAGEYVDSLVKVAENLDNVNLVNGIIYDCLDIKKSASDLRAEIASNSTISVNQKRQLNAEVDVYESDRQAFTLLMSTLPVLVAATGGTMVGPAIVFSALLSAINAAADTFWNYRIGMIQGCEQIEANFTDSGCGIPLTLNTTPDGIISKSGQYCFVDGGLTGVTFGDDNIPVNATVCLHGQECRIGISTGSTVTIRDCTYMEDLSGTVSGGNASVVMQPESELIVNGGIITGNRYDSYKGNLNVPNGSKITIDNGTIIHGIHAETNSEIVINGGVICTNTSYAGHGKHSIWSYNWANSNIEIHGGQLIGGIYVYDPTGTGNSTFNIDDGIVGGVSVDNAALTIEGGTIKGLSVGESCTATVNNGTIIESNDNSDFITGKAIENNGYLIISSGNISGVIKNNENGILDVNGGVFPNAYITNAGIATISNATFQSVDGDCIQNNDGIITISSGKFRGGRYAVFNTGTKRNGKLTINGGEFYGAEAAVSNRIGDITISSGYFHGPIGINTYPWDCKTSLLISGNSIIEIDAIESASSKGHLSPQLPIDAVAGYNGGVTYYSSADATGTKMSIEEAAEIDYTQPYVCLVADEATGGPSGGNQEGCEHNYSSAVTAPTCTERGYTTHTCNQCGNIYRDNYTDALGHKYGEWVVTATATSVTAGQRERICSRCNNKEAEIIPATGGSSSGGSSGGSSSGGSSSSSNYSINTPTRMTGGSIQVSSSSARRGATVTITATPNSGYKLNSLTVTDVSGNRIQTTSVGNDKYTFTMPSSKVTVDASFAAITETPTTPVIVSFTDIQSGAYYADAVAWAVEKGITAGTSTTTFSPNDSCTRAQIVTFLWRAAGSPKATASSPFTDVPVDSYYYDAVLWAVEQGITSGTSTTTFSPDATCTRAQAVTFLYRYEESPVVSGNNTFTDVTAGTYYSNAIQWAVDKNVTAGTSATTFSPNATCTRGQIVTFLYRDMA